MSIESISEQAGADASLRRKRRGQPARPDAQTGDALPVHALEAEVATLSCVLQAWPMALQACHEGGVRKEWFYDLRHQVLYAHLQALASEEGRETLDLVVLMAHLRDAGELAPVGGLPYLNQVQDAAPSAANLAYYLAILKEKWMLRSLQAAAANVALRIRASEGTVDELLAQVQSELSEMAEAAGRHAEQPVKAYMVGVIDNIEDYHRGAAQIRGLSTGLDNVDKMLCGLGQENGNMIVLAARPGIGKTSLALQIAQHVALDCVWFAPQLDATGARMRDAEGHRLSVKHTTAPVAIFSLEMSAPALTDRLVWQRARADKQRWRTGFATDADLAPLAKASIELCKAKIYIDDTPRLSIEELVAKARRMVRQYGIKLFVVDYLQLLRSSKRDWKGDRVQELAYISGLLAAAGKVLNVPFLILAQMNRDWEKESQRPPRLSDLKDSGAIEQDADLVGFIYAPKQNREQEDKFEEMLETVYGDDWAKHPRRLNLLWEKNRHGLTGDCWMLFHKHCTAFEDFNVWMKANKFKELALGDRPAPEPLITDEDMPA